MQNNRYEIGRVYCESWKAAYQNLLPKSYLDGLTQEQQIEVAGCSVYEVEYIYRESERKTEISE